VTLRAGANPAVVHLGTGKLSAVRNRCRGNAGTGANVADLARLSRRNMVRWQPDDLEVGAWDRERCRVGAVTLRAVRRFALGIRVDVDEHRQNRIVGTLVTIGTGR